MNRFNPSMTLGEIVTLAPSLAAELERRGFDYCCHGTRTLEAAANELGLDPRSVADQLSATGRDAEPAPWAALGPAALVDNIESVHHSYLWSALPRLAGLTEKIASVHGERHPELFGVRRVFGELRADLEPHLRREEQVLFPSIRQLDGTGDEIDPAVVDVVNELESEHETVGELLAQLRTITGGYATPADGCASYAACYQGLEELETDTHLHVHKENNVLLPAVRAQLLATVGETVAPGDR